MATGSVYAAKVNLKALLTSWPWPGEAPSIAWGGPTEQEDMRMLDRATRHADRVVDSDVRWAGAGP